MEDDFEEGLEFLEIDGRLEFYYSERTRDNAYISLSKKVPKKVVDKGEEAVMEYVTGKIEEVKNKVRKRESIEDEIRKNHIPIQTEYKDGTHLEGRIVEATSRYIKVKLDSPLECDSAIYFGFASAMSGRYVFCGNEISPVGNDAALEALCDAYSRATNKPLVDRLNKLVKKE